MSIEWDESENSKIWPSGEHDMVTITVKNGKEALGGAGICYTFAYVGDEFLTELAFVSSKLKRNLQSNYSNSGVFNNGNGNCDAH